MLVPGLNTCSYRWAAVDAARGIVAKCRVGGMIVVFAPAADGYTCKGC